MAVNPYDPPAAKRDDDSCSDWPLAALILGGVLFITSPLAMTLAAQIWSSGDRSPNVVAMHAWLARIAMAIALLTAILGVGCGIKGVRLAKVEGRQVGVSFAGLWLSLASLGLWIITAIVFLNTTESMLRNFG